ncbi:MAG: SufD family Fe-S cluster assembly protein, partial [TACK group archaeon]|nr:SufD family Fe-S cluster assembly protein [TACK group archaeon]
GGQLLDAGAKIVHAAPETSALVVSKSISRGNGRTVYRGEVKVNKGARGSVSSVRCDSLLLSDESSTETLPTEQVDEEDSEVSHEASAGRIGEDQLFYLRSRGFSESEATALVIRGFMEPISKKIPLEYAVEFNRLVELELKGAIA